MEETGTAIIGRKVYRKSSNPQMGILFPVLKNSGDVSTLAIKSCFIRRLVHLQLEPLPGPSVRVEE
jgi:hypothetical protein